MRISTKGDYATRALQDLALHYAEGPVPIEAIAQRQALPARYLEQLLLTLKRAGYLASKRGVNGGYYLAKPPREITLGQVLRAVDGAEVRDAVSAIVDHTTLADICDRIRAKTKERISYQI
ncbi:MAG: Rrf2 family transcriptional regulator [candidate division NC10 bacterium]|nr:Rrf2 family transcriptional regulator [candidate division NC10 bacterium]